MFGLEAYLWCGGMPFPPLKWKYQWMLRKGMGVGRTGITHTQQLLAPYRSAPESFCDQEE